ncbi:MAG: hypothetical protein ACR2QO_15340 [Acidimicrobiales bacterium]
MNADLGGVNTASPPLDSPPLDSPPLNDAPGWEHVETNDRRRTSDAASTSADIAGDHITRSTDPAVPPRKPADDGERRGNAWLPWALWLGFLALATGTLLSWQSQELYRPVGDEPHYLVIADGIVADRTFEQTATYEREFTDQVIYPGGLAPAGSTAVPENTHAVVGPNGLFNVHNVGLPLVIALPWAIGGVLATKLLLVALMSAVVPLTWRAAGRYTDEPWIRAISTIAIAYSLPFLLGANQIFPDLPGGVLALVGIDRVLTLAQVRRSDPGSLDARVEPATSFARRTWNRFGADALAVAAIAYLPWLQIKFTAAAMLVAGALALEWRRAGRSMPAIMGRLAPLGLSLGLLAAYNSYAFGKASGPYTDGALQVSVHSMAVLAGLHLDRAQGLLVQNPVYLVGLLFVIPFVRRDWLPGALVVLAYASFVVPNALHPVWYGGTAFAGRFFWSGAVVAAPAVAFGLVRLAELSRRAWFVVVGVSVTATTITWGGFLIGISDIYNRNPNLEYQSMFPIGDRFLPAFRDPDLAFRLGVNLTFLAFAVGLLLLGLVGSKRFRLAASAVVGVWVVLLAATGLAGPYEEEGPLRWSASQLPGDVGAVDGEFRTATSADGPGFVSYGPFVGLWLEEYEYTMEVEADRDGTEPVGVVEVMSSQTGTVLVTHDVLSTPPGEPLVISGRFTVPDELDDHLLEVRAYFNGEGELTVRSLELDEVSAGR